MAATFIFFNLCHIFLVIAPFISRLCIPHHLAVHDMRRGERGGRQIFSLHSNSSQVTLSPAHSAESEMEGWVWGENTATEE